MSAARKIGFVKLRFSPYGGAERYLSTVLENLKRSGYQLHVFSADWEPLEGVVVHEIRTLSFASFASVASFNRRVREAVRKVGPACVLAFERTTAGTIYRAGDGCHREWLEIRRRIEHPLKGLSFVLNPLHRTLLRLEREIFERTPVIVANSELVREHIVRHYPSTEPRIRVIRNGVDARRFHPGSRVQWRGVVRRELRLPDDEAMVLFVGTGFRRKGLGTLIRAFGRLEGRGHLVVIGSGKTAEFERLAAEVGASGRVSFLGPRRDIERYYGAADVFVLPTLYDPFSNATIEAMASGLPVVTTRNNGASEIIDHGFDGYVMEKLDSVGELADLMAGAIAEAPRMGDRAAVKAARHPVDNAVVELLRLIESCAD